METLGLDKTPGRTLVFVFGQAVSPVALLRAVVQVSLHYI